jgi:hypothetical protein
MQPEDMKTFEELSALSPLDAVRAWLDGDFCIGDEPAMISAIRKDSRIKISSVAVEDVILDALDEGLNAEACFKRLTGS